MAEPIGSEYFSADQIAEFDRLACQDHPDLVELATERLVYYQNLYDEQNIRIRQSAQEFKTAIRCIGVLNALGAVSFSMLIKEPVGIAVGTGIAASAFGFSCLVMRTERAIADAKCETVMSYLSRSFRNLTDIKQAEVIH